MELGDKEVAKTWEQLKGGKLIRVYCIHFFNQKYISNHLWHLIIWSLLMVLVGEGSGGVALLEVACPGGRP